MKPCAFGKFGKQVTHRLGADFATKISFQCDNEAQASQLADDLNAVVKKYCGHSFKGAPPVCIYCGGLPKRDGGVF